MSQPFVLYGAEISYFTAKVRPAFRAKRIFIEERLASRRVFREVILPRTGLAFIPVVLTPEDEVWQDTSAILDALEARFPERPLYPQTAVQRVAALLWEIYADEFLLLPAMHYRWRFAESEAKVRGDFAAGTGDPVAANAFADRMSGSLSALGVSETTAPGIEAHTAELLDALQAHFECQPFLLGARPSLADCALMGPLFGHLYQDVVPSRLLRERSPRVCHWIERMNHPDPDAFGDWLPEDALAPSLRPLLELIGRDAVPLLLDTLRSFEAWADDRPEDLDEPPRAVGMHTTHLRGAELQRYTSAYSLWMVQRLLDAQRALSAEQRRRVQVAFDGTGCEALLAYAPRHRLEKRRFKLAFAACEGDGAAAASANAKVTAA